MKRIHYASGSLLTGDAIAEVLLRYAAVLAKNDSAVEVSAPSLTDNGQVSAVLLLLGPASQMLAEEELSEHAELVDDEFVEACERAIRAMGPVRADYVTDGVDEATGLDYDYL